MKIINTGKKIIIDEHTYPDQDETIKKNNHARF